MSPLRKIAHGTFEQQTADAVRTLLTWCVVLSVAFVVALGLSVYGLVRIGNVGSTSCRLQSRGLGAQPYLTASLDDIHALLVLPPSKMQQAARAQIPKRELRRELAIVKDLNANLAAYVTIERKLPHGRNCS